MNYSLTLAGWIAALFVFLAQSIGIDLLHTEEEITQAILTIVGLVSFVVVYIGRVRHNDITWYGRKKLVSPPVIDSLWDDEKE